MPVCSENDATGFGFSPHQATLIGANPKVITGVGTAQAGAAALISKNAELSTGASTYAFIAPTDSKVMQPFSLTCQTATSAVVYPPVGHYLNSVQNAGLTMAQYKSALFWQYKPNYWTYILTA